MGKLLWQPSEERIKASNLYSFMGMINNRFGEKFDRYDQLYKWSIENISDFWASMWDFARIKASKPYDQVVDDHSKMPGAKWFQGAKLNFAENLLYYRDNHPAVIFKGENSERNQMTYAQLYDEVSRVSRYLKEAGVSPDDRVAGFMPNIPETVIAMLAATSLGATWSSCSPDFGIKGVLDRFGQIKPKVLFTADGYLFKGKGFDSLERAAEVANNLPSIEKVVVVPYVKTDIDIGHIPNAVNYADIRFNYGPEEIRFEQFPADHPLYIMFTSGTTGLPKCMVQGAGGILINHLKELLLHADLKREDKIFYFTTCGWMMWNWLISSLGVGATLVLYDGNPFHPDPGALWKMTQDEKITIFGTSAGYIAALQNAGICPAKEFDLSSLRTLLSTGSPLSEEGFQFIYNEVKNDLQLSSISGGSDINGCFAGGNPIGPVYAGELQCRQLAMKVEAFDSKGNSALNERGELVCTAPAPSMPLCFWDDPKGERYHSAYFDVYPNVWRHGDYIEINERGGVVIYGRSDATLNPGGVRIGTAEIYRQVEQVPEIADCLVVGQNWRNDVRVVLFVKMAEGKELNDHVKDLIKTTIRSHASPRHVPAKIVAVPDIPYTRNMKKVELAVKKTIEGEPVLNKDALSNPGVLEFYANIPELQEN